jgi:hypothetical protein
MSLDAERERRVGVAECGHDVRRILAAGERDGGERVAELVRGHADGQRLLTETAV